MEMEWVSWIVVSFYLFGLCFGLSSDIWGRDASQPGHDAARCGSAKSPRLIGSLPLATAIFSLTELTWPTLMNNTLRMNDNWAWADNFGACALAPHVCYLILCEGRNFSEFLEVRRIEALHC